MGERDSVRPDGATRCSRYWELTRDEWCTRRVAVASRGVRMSTASRGEVSAPGRLKSRTWPTIMTADGHAATGRSGITMEVRSSDDVPRHTLLRRFPVPRNFNVAAESRIDTYEIDPR